MHTRRHQGLMFLIVATTLAATGCMGWVPISPTFGVPPTVRVTTEDDRFVLQDAHVSGDTALAGEMGGDPQLIRLADIEFLEGGYTDVGRTALLIVAIPVGVGVVVFACAAGVVCPGLH
jgi:hypothetical protein